MWEYLGLVLCIAMAMLIKGWAMKHRLSQDQYVFIQPEVFAEQWLQEAEEGSEGSIYKKVTNNLESMNDLVIYNLKKIKDMVTSEECAPEQLIESLRKICIIIAVIEVKHESQQQQLVNCLKSISNTIFIRQDILQLLQNYCKEQKDCKEDSRHQKVATLEKYREYIFTHLSHYMFPY